MRIDEMLGSWYTPLKHFVSGPEFAKIGNQLMEYAQKGEIVTPVFDNIFRAFSECPYSELKMVVIGQDPYPGTFPHRHVADGIAFSARGEETPPKSLQFILKAIEDDLYDGLNLPLSVTTDLTPWAAQGILMLNTSLTTNLGRINAHKGLWDPFIEYLLTFLNEHQRGLIFVFLGKQAQEFRTLVRESRHFILTASHPSSANYNGGTWEHNHLFARIDKIMKETHGLSFSWSEHDLVI